MRLVSWNVNGLRALHRQGYWNWFEKTKPDVFCLQEIKAEMEQLPPEVANPDGYHAHFNSSQERKGYSGVATYSSVKPEDVSYDVLPDEFNTQGRLIQTEFKDFVLLNVYFPNGGRDKERLEYKLDFYDAFLEHIETLRSQGHGIVCCGDFNVAHEEIDIARPKENQDHTGFLPEERAWVDELISLGYVDTWRHFNPDRRDVYTYWDTVTRARERNVGWRIDYFFVSPDILPWVVSADVLGRVYGSDHCPIELTLK